MTVAFRYEYDIEFEVLADHRDEYEAWLPEATVLWGLDEHVAAFGQQYSDTGPIPGRRFTFEFETLEDWASFVEGDTHRKNIQCLEELTTELCATLWQPNRLDRHCSTGGRTLAVGGTRQAGQHG
ncbi:hypothetical protein [Haloferax sp. YSSS75]|uniref:hypothetical protein n=1 Tax=Haloferax sp. YSSS75 TaxID=3388564 RepID=UPI00398CCA0D